MKKEGTSDFWWMLLLLYGFIFWPSSSAKTDQDLENSLLWEISGNGLEKPSHLFGTFHLLKEDYLESMPHVVAAFEASDGIVVETVLDTAEMMQHIHKMFMPENSLKKLYSPKVYQKMAQKFEEATGQPLAPMNQMKPNAVMMQLIELSAAEAVANFRNKEGEQLDMYFAHVGAAADKPISELETIGLQMDLLMNSVAVEEQAEALEWAINHLDVVRESQFDLAKYYLNQNMNGLAGLSEDYPEMGDLGVHMEDMLDKRNENWMTQLPELMEGGGQFIAVGALHLVGETGLIHQLRAAGYTLTPVLN